MAVAILVVGGGCGPPETCTSASATLTPSVLMLNSQFHPSCVEVSKGLALTFTNDDLVAHTVTTDPGQVESFDSGDVAPHATFQHSFATSGTIHFHCARHSTMTAAVVVQ